jgi:hypothetical protein
MRKGRASCAPPRALGPDPRIKAVELLGRWTRVGKGHLPLGGGCSCGAPAVSVRIADLERDVLDYLASRHASAQGAGSIADLLRGIASSGGGADRALLADFERSLESFETVHR